MGGVTAAVAAECWWAWPAVWGEWEEVEGWGRGRQCGRHFATAAVWKMVERPILIGQNSVAGRAIRPQALD